MKTLSRIVQGEKRLLPLSVILPVIALLTMSTPVLAAPAIGVSPASGAIGTRVTISGTVFDSYKGDNVFIFFDDDEITDSPKVVDDTGTFTAEFTVPGDISPGTYWIEARSETSSTSMLAKSFFIVEEAEIAMDVTDGPVGTVVNITGRGFYAERTVTFYYRNNINEKLGTELASATGEFSFQFVVPYSAAGYHKVTATNAEGNSISLDFEVLPTVELNLSSAGPGDLVTATGDGFGNKSDVDIYFNNEQVATARTDEYGNFEINFNIPDVNSGTYDVKALDNDGNQDKTRLTVTAGARLDETEGSAGSEITVEGSGFKGESKVVIKYDDETIGTTTTDKNGAFSTTIKVPTGDSGEHIITVSDGETSRRLSFEVESEAPPVPTLLLPADNSETRAGAFLDWQDITDSSLPVTYDLQIAADPNFSSIVLEKQGLTESEYTLSEMERLSVLSDESPYYWRIRARDSANNISAWSDSKTFYVSAPGIPELLLPEDGSQAEQPLLFNWQGVTSLEPPVTYHLQVAADANFINMVLDIDVLADSEYSMTEDEKLPNVGEEDPYYWRVKARDSASNESDWSAPQTFHTSSFTMPLWLIIVLVAIFVAIVGYVAFRVGKHTALNPPE